MFNFFHVIGAKIGLVFMSVALFLGASTTTPPTAVQLAISSQQVATSTQEAKVTDAGAPVVVAKKAPATSPTTQSSSQGTGVASASSNTPAPNTTLCNGTSYTACPAGQDFVCPANGGKAYCNIPTRVTPQSTETQTAQLPAPTATQLAGVYRMCAAVPNVCNTDPTFWSDYYNVQAFRTAINAVVLSKYSVQPQQNSAPIYIPPTLSPAAPLLQFQQPTNIHCTTSGTPSGDIETNCY